MAQKTPAVISLEFICKDMKVSNFDAEPAAVINAKEPEIDFIM